MTDTIFVILTQATGSEITDVVTYRMSMEDATTFIKIYNLNRHSDQAWIETVEYL